MKSKKPKILVGMSGGVDSSSVVAILKKQGYAVRGLFFVLHDDSEKTEKDLADLENVSEKLGIECEILDVRKRFKRDVIKYFLDSYASNRTPNPCVFCNENFKFKLLLEEADKAGIKYIATGHYARIISNSKSLISNQVLNKSKIKNPKTKTTYKLQAAKDKNKDQSYFLYRLGQEELKRIIFPLGEYEKTEVRKLAKKLGLSVSEKKESQDVCFMTGLTTEIFLKKNLELKKGKIETVSGKVIGEHFGLPLYTIGQRKGIKVGGTGPYYVIAKDAKKNILVVTNDKKELSLFSKTVKLEDVKWVDAPPKLPVKVLARSRYRNPLVYATIKTDNVKHMADNSCEIEFEKPEKAVATGQSVVFYAKNGEVLGGGIIK